MRIWNRKRTPSMGELVGAFASGVVVGGGAIGLLAALLSPSRREGAQEQPEQREQQRTDSSRMDEPSEQMLDSQGSDSSMDGESVTGSRRRVSHF